MTFFDSRWIETPPHVTETSGLPKGFKGAGVASGVKVSGKPDVAVIFSELPTASAARFTRSGVLAPPVIVSKNETKLSALRAIAANSGNANAAVGSGDDGLDEARKMQQSCAESLGIEVNEVAVASTGVIGVPLPIDRVYEGITAACSELSREGDGAVSEAIMTTDKFEKRVSLKVGLSGGNVHISAQSKGAGMIQPNFATMFCFVQTDAGLDPEQCDDFLGVMTDRSFNRISVDGQLSTNDTVILQANGASGVVVEPGSKDEEIFATALDALMRQLAILLVRDGEGSKRVGRVVVSGSSDEEVERVARSIANSPLVKAALHGGDPNWGRIAQAVGGAMLDLSPFPFDIEIEGKIVCSAGLAVDFDQEELDQLVSGPEVEYEIRLPGSEAECELYFSDLSHEYVTINAEYTT